MRLLMHGGRCLCAGRGAHAKEFAVLPVHPILVVFDPVLALNLLIGVMSFGEILGSNSAGQIVNVDVGRHLRISVRRQYYTLTGISHAKLSRRVNADSEWLCLQSVGVCFLLKIWAERF